MRAVGSPRRARTVLAVPSHWSSRPAPRSRRVRNHRPRRRLRHRASSVACSPARGPRPLARRTSSWWTKNSFRLGSWRTHPMRKNPGGGPDRNVATSHVNSLSASALLRRSASRPHAPGKTSPGPARESCSRRTRCAARSRVVHGARRVGASGPSSSSRSLSCARSTASKRGSAISPECSQAGGGLWRLAENEPHAALMTFCIEADGHHRSTGSTRIWHRLAAIPSRGDGDARRTRARPDQPPHYLHHPHRLQGRGRLRQPNPPADDE
jgi:hypothetical protein